MDPLREPRSTEQAAALLEHWADLDEQVATIEADRTRQIAAVNADCDRAANALVERRDAAQAKLASWWGKAGVKLTAGKRKSIEPGGCELGSRAGRPSLAIAGEEAALIETLKRRQWAVGLLAVKTTLDKVAIRKALAGALKKRLQALGFGEQPGAETFFVKRTDQGGTLGGE